ncbi:UDP-N-acetylmuramoyl-tripeptide--D-alanyl-D-alanine ligase [Halosquirtibacter xylanolyticus]|uniref:UDP-N-acetylmuramoyl-tripeptide--D-alanyl-D- alanine ligase n=1 Tax=Halosquirtibacter xylanolyticus TaxID=3374599 RepID=UPI00374A377C|nr:UDP-N-acetylmuramoyl-tripeptide--D-alanyl-D-alanine ligase [Prolixibacteraceae bacterium]
MVTVKALHEIFLAHPIISTDTRKIISQSIFFALKGSNFDGNKYIDEAIRRGASFVVYDNPEYGKEDDKYLLVDDVLTTLQKLANYHRRSSQAKIIGITGTNGKTTTKELIFAVLKTTFKTIATEGNLNNHIGVPLSLLTIKPEDEIAIIEMGANHPKEIGFLCSIAEPNYGIITNVGKAHLEGFGSFEMIQKTKAELYHCVANRGGKLFIHYEDTLLKNLLPKDVSTISYSTEGNSNADTYIKEESDNSILIRLKAKFPKGFLYILTNLVGTYNCSNLAAAISIGKYFNVEPLRIKEAIEGYIPTNLRSQYTRRQYNDLIVDTYNANPSSMQEAIKNFLKLKHPNKIVILGDMLELGDVSEQEHLKLIELLKEGSLKECILVGEIFSKIAPNANTFLNTDELIQQLQKDEIKEALVLIKGSRGIGLEKILYLF